MTGAGFGVYIHWPYCSRICPYCDFNVYRARDRDPAPLLAAIIADLEGQADRIEARPAGSVFLGGGTPSLLDGHAVAGLLAAVDRLFGLDAGAEITLEANPEDWARFGDHAAAGVNRFSIGVQSLRDEALTGLGRAHDAGLARRAVEAAAATGRRVSIDLIYAREGQTPDDWAAELREALALPIEHLSAYQLTIEEGTAFDRAVRRGRLKPPGEGLAADLYETTQAVCEAAGYPAYEISNHARTAAARSAHNLLYWRGGEWVGAGPGAHGRVNRQGVRWAVANVDRVADYTDAVAARGTGWGEAEALAPSVVAEEALMMGLRTYEGVDPVAIAQLRGAPLDPSALASLRDAGLVETAAGRLRLTAAGRLVADRIAVTLATTG